MSKLFQMTAATALMLAGAGAASAQSVDAAATTIDPAAPGINAVAGTDLNIRSGPGVQHGVIGVIPGGESVGLAGCIEDVNWCEITYNDTAGWVDGGYLATNVGEEPTPIYPNRVELKVPVVVYEGTPPADAKDVADLGVGAAAGASAGALAAGPLGAVVGAAIGATAAQLPEPSPEVQAYVVEHPQTPVFLDGEVVIGAGVPENVTLYDIPDTTDYQYATINELPVLVNADRKIVYIYR